MFDPEIFSLTLLLNGLFFIQDAFEAILEAIHT